VLWCKFDVWTFANASENALVWIVLTPLPRD